MDNQAVAVIILAAGKGTRMKSRVPKVLHELCGTPLLRHAIAAAQQIKPGLLSVVLRHEKAMIEEYLGVNYPEIRITEQDEIPGTGRAVQCALEQLAIPGDQPTTVIVTSGDVPLLEGQTLEKLYRQHQQSEARVTVLSTVVEDATGYGRIIRNEDGDLAAIIEHRDATAEQRQICEINAGIYAFDLDFLEAALRQVGSDNDQGEVYLTDTVKIATEKGERAGIFQLADSWQAEGCNDRAQLAALAAELNRRTLAFHMANGVSIIDPKQTWIEPGSEIAADVTIDVGCILRGKNKIGSFAEIGPYTYLENCEIDKLAEVRFSDLRNYRVPSTKIEHENMVIFPDHRFFGGKSPEVEKEI